MNHALLLTDVVDSTKLSEQLGDAAMARVWAAHDRVARDLLEPHRGREIDKTDGFLLLFEAAGDAVAYAVAYHRAIGALDPPLKARAGLHVGPVILTENAPADVARGAKPLEVDGLAKPTAARIMSVAVGGQTLLSEPARQALGETSLRVVPHGHWRMKGVAEPIALFEVGEDDAPFTPPPDGAKVYRVVSSGQHWLPVREVKHGLPTERDAFVGRSHDLLALARLVDDGAHLINVLGIGGTGKTRLVTHYAWTWLGDFPGGAWFCDLSEARDADGVAAAVARALDVPLGKDDPVVQLGHALAARGRCLVLLDNFEQVARHAPATLGRWLDRAHDAVFVVTSREVLGLPGEAAFALPPLVPAESVDLFVARALQAKRDFVVDDRPSIEALVKLLDGLPLAIELAAARVRLMPPKALLAKMSDRFKVLASAGGRHTRQATLRATFDWSWDLLSEDERQALAQLAVFEGGFTLEAAEAVLALAEAWPMDVVQALVDRSWLRRVGEERFDMLVSVQEYAAEKLAASGGRVDAEARHGAFFATFGTSEAVDALSRHGGGARLRALTAELDNLVVATRRAVARGDGACAAATCRAAGQGLSLRGPATLHVELAEALDHLVAQDPELGASAAMHLGNALRFAGRPEAAQTCFEQARTRAASGGESTLREARLLMSLGALNFERGLQREAAAKWEAALAIVRAIGSRVEEGALCANLGVIESARGHEAEARAWLTLALTIHREVGDRAKEGSAFHKLGNLERKAGHAEAAHAALASALAILHELGDRRTVGNVLADRGLVFEEQRRWGEARADLDAALAIHREVGNRRSEGNVLTNLGSWLANRGQAQEALAVYDLALAVLREVGNRLGENIVLHNLALEQAKLGRFDAALGSLMAAAACYREADEAHGETHASLDLGTLLRDRGQPEQARTPLERALAISRRIGSKPLEADSLRSLGEVLAELGHDEEARLHLEGGANLSRELGRPREEALALRALAALHARWARPDDAALHFDRAVTLLRSASDPGGLAGALADRSRFLATTGDAAAARRDLAEAVTLADTADDPADKRLLSAIAAARAAVEAL